MKKKSIKVFLTRLLVLVITSMPVEAAWIQEENNWKYEVDKAAVMDGWIIDSQENYYMGTDGYLKAGWLQMPDKTWYFLNTLHDGTYGRALKGWQWIDGYCYFFREDGTMIANTLTPDGYQVDEKGAWIVDGTYQHIPGKGIMTIKPATRTIRFVGGSGGGSYGGSSRPLYASYRYTIQYIDIKTNSVLYISAGQGKKNDSISAQHPWIENYQICADQKSEFVLNTDNQIMKLYYQKLPAASPSEAEKVHWQVYFVEDGGITNEIFKRQEGNAEEGAEIFIDFPETVFKNGIHYRSSVSSPHRILLYGTGTQKHYIRFAKSEGPIEPELDAPARERLENWLDISRIADETLMGFAAIEELLITKNTEESNRRLKNLVSMVHDTRRHEVYVIARNHTPSSFAASQFSPHIINISEMIVDRFSLEEDDYTVLKVGFQRIYDKDTCSHDFMMINDVDASCLTNGTETVICEKCSYEVTVITPATGHQSRDNQDICNLCYEIITENERPEAAYFELGDIQSRKVGDEIYLFRCIDEDYEDGLNNKQKVALFLCEKVIRSDVDSTSKEHKTMAFGSNNNYKTSTIRNWLQINAVDNMFATQASYTGISLAYMGATEKGSYEEFHETSLIARSKPFQLLEDNIFLLSVEEAIKYKEYLWKFNDSGVNNPESQYSAYSKGYWLRSPQYKEMNGQFTYGTGVYMVSLVDGNIHTVEAGHKSIGMRPAITVAQYK